MNTNKQTARIVGVLFLVATATYMLGNGLLADILTVPNFLSKVYPNKTQLVIGVLFQFIDTAAVVGIGIMLFPILKKYSEIIALGYLGSRIVECIFLVAGGLKTLSLITLSQKYAQAGTQDALHFQTLGSLIVAENYLAYQIAMIALGLGSLLFCYLLYTTKLVPQLIAVLGLVGYAALLTGGLLELFGLEVGLWLSIPGGLFELILPGWLLVKGFNATPSTVPTTKINASNQLA